MGDIEINIPLEVLIPDQRALQYQLKTSITHIPHVNEITGVTDRRRCIQGEEHITGFPVEIIEATA